MRTDDDDDSNNDDDNDDDVDEKDKEEKEEEDKNEEGGAAGAEAEADVDIQIRAQSSVQYRSDCWNLDVSSSQQLTFGISRTSSPAVSGSRTFETRRVRVPNRLKPCGCGFQTV